jgi:hypothetical protein
MPMPTAQTGLLVQPQLTAAVRQRNAASVTSLLLGSLGVLFFWLGLSTLVMVVLAIIFGGAGIRRARMRNGAGKRMAIAGLLLGSAGLCIYLVFGAVTLGEGYIW